MKKSLTRLNDWIDLRTGLPSAIRTFLYEDIPASSGWHQVFGSVAISFSWRRRSRARYWPSTMHPRPATPTTAFATS